MENLPAAPAADQQLVITAVMPMRDAARYLPTCLPALLAAAARHGRTNVVIVDNGSADNSQELARELAGDAAIHRSVPAGTISTVRNVGARTVSSDIVAFIDADCLIDPDYFIEMERVFQDPRITATGSMYDIPDHPHWTERAWYQLHRRVQDGPVHSLNGGNLAVRRAMFEEVGGFPEGFITGEDAEFCLRMRGAGATIYESHRVRAVHLGNPQSSTAFFRKHVWHGLGMFGTNAGLDKPTTMMLAHAAYIIAALILLLVSPEHVLGAPLAVAVLPWVVPLVTVAYRVHHLHALPATVDLLCAVYLCQLYYLARLTAAFHIARGRLAPRMAPQWRRIRA